MDSLARVASRHLQESQSRLAKNSDELHLAISSRPRQTVTSINARASINDVCKLPAKGIKGTEETFCPSAF